MLLMLSEKGKYASATENRRFVWAEIVWPLILEVNDVSFSLNNFKTKEKKYAKKKTFQSPFHQEGWHHCYKKE